MPKWLSSLLIAIGFIALVILAVLPRDVDITVNVKEDTAIATVNHNAGTPSGENHETAGNED